MRIKSLQMRARVVVEGFIKGIHRSPYHGFSVEFTEYRQYSPGDDPRYLDWRLYARTDRYYIKRFEDETNLRCHLVLDTSRSMGYRSGAYTKSDYARTAAATIAYFLSLQRDAVGLLHVRGSDQRLSAPAAPPRPSPPPDGVLEREPQGRATDLAAPLEQIAATVRKRGLIILISDLLAPIDALRTRLGYLRSRGHEVVVLRVLDPAEVEFRFETPGDVPRRRIGPRAVHRPGRRPRGLRAAVRRASVGDRARVRGPGHRARPDHVRSAAGAGAVRPPLGADAADAAAGSEGGRGTGGAR